VSRVVHFEIPADHPERAAKFYTKVFGWKINKWEGGMDYWLVTTGDSGTPGIDGAIMQRSEMANTVVNSIDVPSVDDFLKKVTKNGGKVVTPKTPIPGVGYFAYCKDTEGNMFGIMQPDESVK
jgi:predicted enzyme related to lactoylglutathione lyase